MKPTLLFAMLSLVFAVPQATATTELETLRAKCIEQERQIRRLEEQLDKLKPTSSPATQTSGKATPVSTAPGKAAPAEGTTYKVLAGDSLEKIARKTGNSPTKLATANGIKTSTVIHPGQTLKLPGTAIAQTAAPQATPTAHVTKESTTGSSYTIKQGETYASISRKTKIPVDSLIACNPGIKPTALRPGQVIRLTSTSSPAAAVPQPKAAAPIALAPATSHTTVVSTPVKHPAAPEHAPMASKPAEKPASASHPAAPAASAQPATKQAPATADASIPAASQEAKTSPSNPEKKIRSVTIEGEMTYGEFATKHGTDTNRLNDLNGLDLTQATVLAKGSELYVPAQP